MTMDPLCYRLTCKAMTAAKITLLGKRLTQKVNGNMGSWLACIYTQGKREVIWSDISCRREQCNGRATPTSIHTWRHEAQTTSHSPTTPPINHRFLRNNPTSGIPVVHWTPQPYQYTKNGKYHYLILSHFA